MVKIFTLLKLNKKMNRSENQEMEFPIIFPRWRTGDRDSIYDYDFSINKVNENLVFVSSVVEENGYGEKANHYSYRKELVLKGDFFSNYSKAEFLTVLKILTDAKFDIPEKLKFNRKGITTIWKEIRKIEELKEKDYFVSYQETWR